MRFYTATLAAAGALGLAFLVLPSHAQEYGQPQGYGQPYGNDNNYEGTNLGGPNEVIVIGPNLRARTSPLNAPPEDVSISQRVSYADLDLRTREGAYELRKRVRLTAARICGQLREIYPYALNPHTACFRQALSNSMPKANEAIDNARIDARRAYEDGYYGGYDR